MELGGIETVAIAVRQDLGMHQGYTHLQVEEHLNKLEWFRMTRGTVYILINEAMPGYVKVGKTTSHVEQRMKELDTSGVPLPFECFYAATVADLDFVERQLHDAFGDNRARKRREFFQIDPARVASALQLAALEDVTPKEDVVENRDDRRALDKAKSSRGMFNMEMVNIEPGSTLIFAKGDNITCTVLDKHQVEFEGERVSLTRAALTVIHRLGYEWQKIAGPQYWVYEEETLYQRKNRMESED